MKSTFLLAPLVLAAGFSGAAQAQQDSARVLSSIPVIQQVAVPQQVCAPQQVITNAPKSGAGAAIGAIAGGAAGNAIGQGNGRAAATVLGLVGGALLGNHIEGSNQQVQTVNQCTTQTRYENRTVGYNVTYEYAGRQYTVQMPHDPGPYIQVQISPVAPAGASMAVPPVQTAPVSSIGSEVIVASAPQVVYSTSYVSTPTYVYPAYAPVVPVGISVNGWYGPRHGHPHWR